MTRLAVIIASLLMIAGCGDVRVQTPDIQTTAAPIATRPVLPASPEVQAQIVAAQEAQRDAEARAKAANDAAISAARTSNDARAQAESLRAQIASAKHDLAELEAQKVEAEKKADALQREEVAASIRFWSMWLMVGGGLAIIAGAVLGWFVASRLYALSLIGAGSFALGLFGIWIAPHWLGIAYGVGIAVAIVAIGALIWGIRHFHSALSEATDHGDRLKSAALSAASAVGTDAAAAVHTALEKVSNDSRTKQAVSRVRSLINRVRSLN